MRDEIGSNGSACVGRTTLVVVSLVFNCLLEIGDVVFGASHSGG